MVMDSSFPLYCLKMKTGISQHDGEVGGPEVPCPTNATVLRREDLEFQEYGLQSNRNISSSPQAQHDGP